MEFVKANGLLGILPIFGVAIRFPLVPSGTIRLLPSPYAKWHITSPEPATLMKQEGYVRLGGEWTKTDVRFIVRGDDRKNLPKAGVTLLRADCIGTEEWPLSALRSYFPSLDPSRQCPHPGTQDFFRHYAESIDGIRELAMHFLEAVTDLGDHHVGPKHLLNAAAFWISAVAQSAAPAVSPNHSKHSLEEVRHSAGLLASYVLMFLLDRKAGRRVIPCEVCGRFLVSEDWRVAYCSISHRRTASSKRYREKKIQPERTNHV